MYAGKPYSYYHFKCEREQEDYGMGWTPRHCPICGGKVAVTRDEVWHG